MRPARVPRDRAHCPEDRRSARVLLTQVALPNAPGRAPRPHEAFPEKEARAVEQRDAEGEEYHPEPHALHLTRSPEPARSRRLRSIATRSALRLARSQVPNVRTSKSIRSSGAIDATSLTYSATVSGGATGVANHSGTGRRRPRTARGRLAAAVTQRAAQWSGSN